MTDQRTITAMFDDIAPRYDFLNHLLSFHIDKIWRKKASRMVAQNHPKAILDVATGTADLAIRLAKDNPTAAITGIDPSEKMLEIGKGKVKSKKLDSRIRLLSGDVIKLPFSDNCFDAVTVGFGVRNFSNLVKGLEEMARVAKPQGTIAILEFSQPHSLLKTPYQFYFKHLVPCIGGAVSKHKTAYTYLPNSVDSFPEPQQFIGLLEAAGLSDIQRRTLSGGIATLYTGYVEKTK